MIQGFDSRWWNGVIPEGYDYKFAYMKATEGDDFSSPEFPMQWAALQSYGLPKGAFCFHRQNCSVSGLASRFYGHVAATGHFGALPPVLDFEDTRARPSLALVEHMNDCLKAVEDKFGRACMIYSAKWWWDRWAKPYVQDHHLFYERELWEADPPPDTPSPGEWGKPAVVQVKLDWSAPGWNAAIDVNETTQEWLDKYIKQEEPFHAEVVVPASFKDRNIVITVRKG